MGLKFNGRRILQSSFIRFMGRSCSRVLFNARVVWQRIPDYLYNAGDQITEWTGGWQQKDTYMAHNDYWFGNTPGAVSGLNGQLTINADNMKAYMPYDGQLYQGVLVSTVKQIDLTHISGLTAIFTASEMWGGGYASMGVTQRFENKYQPISATGGDVYKRQADGNRQRDQGCQRRGHMEWHARHHADSGKGAYGR